MRILYFSSFYRSFPFKEAALDRTHCFVGGGRDIGNCNPTVNSELSLSLTCNSTSAHLLSESQIVQTFLSDWHATAFEVYRSCPLCLCANSTSIPFGFLQYFIAIFLKKSLLSAVLYFTLSVKYASRTLLRSN